MGLIADSGAIYAIYDSGDRHHQAVRTVLERESGPVIIPSVILAEVDFLLRRHLGVAAEVDFLDGIAIGAFTLEPFTTADVARCRELITQYRDADLGLADAAVVATAERLGIRRILTVDERDFRLVRPACGEAFVLLPADSNPHGDGS